MSGGAHRIMRARHPWLLVIYLRIHSLKYTAAEILFNIEPVSAAKEEGAFCWELDAGDYKI